MIPPRRDPFAPDPWVYQPRRMDSAPMLLPTMPEPSRESAGAATVLSLEVDLSSLGNTLIYPTYAAGEAPDTGFSYLTAEVFLGIFGDSTPQRLMLSWRYGQQRYGGTALAVRVEHGDGTQDGDVVFPNAHYTHAIAGDVREVEPTSTIKGGVPLFLRIPMAGELRVPPPDFLDFNREPIDYSKVDLIGWWRQNLEGVNDGFVKKHSSLSAGLNISQRLLVSMHLLARGMA